MLLQTKGFQDCPAPPPVRGLLQLCACQDRREPETLACYSCVLAGRLFQATCQQQSMNVLGSNC